MSAEKNKSTAIPTRHDPEVVAMVEKLSEVTGIGKSEIIRRAVKFALLKAKEENSLDFLLGNPSDIRKALQQSGLSQEAPASISELRVAEEGNDYKTVSDAKPGEISPLLKREGTA